jgi:hypothetical protein
VSFVGLYVRRRDWMTGREYRDPITSDACWKCGAVRPDLAHAVHEYVAAILGAELGRRVDQAVAEHRAAHGCPPPLMGCREVEALYDLLPDYMRPVPIA